MQSLRDGRDFSWFWNRDPGTPPISFKHSGDLGDIIYSLPVVAALTAARRTKARLLLDVTGGTDDPYCAQQCPKGRTKFDAAGFGFIGPLLAHQPYVESVEIWDGSQADYNLNAFRQNFDDRPLHLRNLSEIFMLTFAQDGALSNVGLGGAGAASAYTMERLLRPWLRLTLPPLRAWSADHSRELLFIVNRTPRYTSNFTWWSRNAGRFASHGAFVGLPKEHEIFEYTFGEKIRFLPVANALELAQYVAGAKCTFGNESVVMAIAIGLGAPFEQEMNQVCPLCIFQRSNGRYF